MAVTTIYIMNDGSPVVGASVIAGELGVTKVTDSEGKVSANFAEGYDVVMDIGVETADDNFTITTLRIQNGGTYIINVNY